MHKTAHKCPISVYSAVENVCTDCATENTNTNENIIWMICVLQILTIVWYNVVYIGYSKTVLENRIQRLHDTGLDRAMGYGNVFGVTRLETLTSPIDTNLENG